MVCLGESGQTVQGVGLIGRLTLPAMDLDRGYAVKSGTLTVVSLRTGRNNGAAPSTIN